MLLKIQQIRFGPAERRLDRHVARRSRPRPVRQGRPASARQTADHYFWPRQTGHSPRAARPALVAWPSHPITELRRTWPLPGRPSAIGLAQILSLERQRRRATDLYSENKRVRGHF